MLLFLIQIAIILSSCSGPNFLEQDAKDGPVDSRTTVNSGEGAFKSTLSATTNLPQLIEVKNEASSINGTSLTVAPGSLAISTAVTMEPSTELVTGSFLQDIKVSGGGVINSASESVLIQPEQTVNPVGSLVISLPLNTTSLWLNSQNFAVVYEVFDYTNNKYLKGIIPSADIKIENSEAVFEVEHFGSYQVIKTDTEVTQKTELESEQMPQSKRVYNETPLIELQTPTILFNAAMRELTVNIDITDISQIESCRVYADNDKLLPYTESVEWNLISNRVIIGLKSSLNIVSARLECRDKNQRLILSDWSSVKDLNSSDDGVNYSDNIPYIEADESLICSDIVFYNATGDLTTGTKNCSGPADCTTDGEVGCVATAAAPVALATNLNPGYIRNGQTIGGVTGNLVLPNIVAVAAGQQYGGNGTEFTGTASGMPVACTADAQEGCVSNSIFPAMDITNAADKILAGQTLGGVTGNVVLPLAADVRFTVSYGVSGTGKIGSVVDCSFNGDDNCYVDSSSIYDAADLSNLLEENIKSGVTIAGTAGGYPSSTYPLDSASTTPDLDTATFNAKIKSSDSFEYWTSEGVRHTNTGDANIIEANIKDGVTIFGTEGTYEGPIAPPSNFVSTETSPTQIDHTWDSVSGASSYLLIVNVDSPVTFTPTNGTAYSVGSQGGGDILYVGNSIYYTHTVSANSTYHYALYSYDGSDYSLVASTNLVSTLDCSDTTHGEWIRVPGNVAYEANDFCVMKYESKCSNANGQSCPSTDTPTSIADGTPWVEINQTEAIDACDDIPGAQLISNDQWMTIATNIANQASNWEDGSVGSGALNRGHSDDSPSSALAATGSHGAWNINRRTHTLSNGEVIWDMAGNVSEYTSYFDAYNKPTPATGNEYYVSNSDRATGITGRPLTEFISQEGIVGNWSRNEGTGYLYSGPEGSGGALFRGGYWNVGTNAGIFAATLNYDSSASNTNIGFRCVRL